MVMTWQPIETAPRNMPLLVYDPYYLVRVARYYEPESLRILKGIDCKEGVWFSDIPYGDERGEIEMELWPTHWCYIPYPLPKESK